MLKIPQDRGGGNGKRPRFLGPRAMALLSRSVAIRGQEDFSPLQFLIDNQGSFNRLIKLIMAAAIAQLMLWPVSGPVARQNMVTGKRVVGSGKVHR